MKNLFKFIGMFLAAILALLVIIVVATLIWSKLGGRSYSFRYRMTVEVETPQGLKTASNVFKIVYSWKAVVLNPSAGTTDVAVYGESIFVDLGAGRNAIVTLTESGSNSEEALDVGWLPLKIYDIPWDKKQMPLAIERAEAAGPVVVPFKRLPLIITLDDLKNPLSIKRVDPNRFDATFGAGYALKQVTIEASKDPTTDMMLMRRLPWLFDVGEGFLDGGGLSSHSPLGLSGFQLKSNGG